MAEEVKNVRLSKAAKEFNIATTTVVEFLAKKGISIDSNPNTKITEEMYQMLQNEFETDKTVKKAASKVGLEYKNESLSVDDSVKTKSTTKAPVEEGELLIKKSIIEQPKSAKKETIKKVVKSVEEVEEKVEEEKPAIIEIPVVIEEEPEIKIDEPSEIKELEPIVDTNVIEEDETENPAIEQEINKKKGITIIDKIDLSAQNFKTRPSSKTKEEKEEERVKKKLETKKKKESKTEEKVVEKGKTVVEKKPDPTTEKEPIKEAPVQPTVEEKKINFYETKHVTLGGPKLTGEKIDLSKFTKPSSGSNDKNHHDKHEGGGKKEKRARISNNPSKKGFSPVPVDKDSNVASSSKPNWKEKKHAKKEKPVVKISEVEIEKQLKETLASMRTAGGKSQTSKHNREKREQLRQQKQEDLVRQQEDMKVLKVTEFVTANELASMMGIPVTNIITTCFTVGLAVSINQRLTAETISLLADEYGYTIEFVDADVMEEVKEEEDKPEDIASRPPIVTVMGHVDHGKTSLLDYIRKTNVIAGESGGITQHIGAYEVTLESGKKITFLDTPGHEAFTAMRARGAKVTDIAIIVVAADDKIMPQTKEAINHAQAAGVPIIFAINKIDKPAANPDKIKQELAEMNLLVEEWGGKYQSQDISAKQGLNVDVLLEKILLEAELLDLKANPKKRAKGTVIESSLDKGRGYVAKLLVEDGSIKVGDVVLAGHIYGKVKAMYNERNQAIEKAGPATPLLLLGLTGAPQAGDVFHVMGSEKEAKEIATRRMQLQREQGLRTQKHITLDEIGRRIAIGDFKELNIIVKGDVDGSVEALADSLLKLSTPEVQVNVIHQSVGQITESDVLLASASEAVIVGFQVRPSVAARRLAENEQIDIRLYSIIYNAIEEIKDAIEGMLSPEIEEKIVCNLEVREVFKINKVGTIAGCIVLDGKINRQTKVRIIRDGIVAYTGKLGSLKRFKDDVKEVYSGQDCGLNIENFNDVKVGDIIEGYEQIEIKRTL